MALQLAGLDIETTGVDINAGHRLIQFAAVLPDGQTICHDVLPMGVTVTDPYALQVNGFDVDRIEAGTPNDELDQIVHDKLALAGYNAGDLTPVGWNVGGFDMGFVKRELPKTSAFFSYRTLDLTGLAMLYELRTGVPYRDLKQKLYEEAVRRMGTDKRHDALWDAQAALETLKLFQEMDWGGARWIVPQMASQGGY